MFANQVDWEPAIQTITALAVLLVALVKPVVDAIKLAFPNLPSAAFPALAVVTGFGMMLLLAVSTNAEITAPLIAQMVLASLISAVSASGINRLHDKADEAIEQHQLMAAKKKPVDDNQDGSRVNGKPVKSRNGDVSQSQVQHS